MSSKRDKRSEFFWSIVAAAMIFAIGYAAPKQDCAAPAEVRRGR